MTRKIFILTIFLNLGTAFAAGPHVDRVSEIALYPSALANPSYISGSNSEQSNLYFFANTRFTLSLGDSTFEIQPELRALQSDEPLGPEMRAGVRAPARLMDLHKKLDSGRKNESTLDLERLNFLYRVSGTQLSVGRKPVSLGVLSVFPVWNKFSRPLMTDYGPLRTFNQDQVSMRVQRGEWLIEAMDIEERDARAAGATRVAQLSWFGDGLELHAIGGEWWQSGAFGLALVKDAGGTSLKLEEISFSGDGAQIGLGAERAFTEKLSALTEFLYLESGASYKRDYFFLTPSRFRPLSARAYAFGRVEYKPGPLWIVQAGDLVNLVDSSQLLNLKAIYSAGNDFELTGEFRLPAGGDDGELSRHFVPTQVLFGARYDF